MDDRESRSRTATSREYGHPWPGMVEEIVQERFERYDGRLGNLASEFDCHPSTLASEFGGTKFGKG